MYNNSNYYYCNNWIGALLKGLTSVVGNSCRTHNLGLQVQRFIH